MFCFWEVCDKKEILGYDCCDIAFFGSFIIRFNGANERKNCLKNFYLMLTNKIKNGIIAIV